MNKLIIDRANWNSGQRYSADSSCRSTLVNKTHKMCCLGFLGRACGLEQDQMLCIALPWNDDKNLWTKKLFDLSGVYHENAFQWMVVFAEINDAKDIDHSIREEWIKEGFKTILNYEVEFVGQYEN